MSKNLLFAILGIVIVFFVLNKSGITNKKKAPFKGQIVKGSS